MKQLILVLVLVCLVGCTSKHACQVAHPERSNHHMRWQQSTPHETDTNLLHTLELVEYDEPVRTQ